MELFASPLACSLASHIAVIEAGLPVTIRFVENKKTDDGGDFFAVSPYGYVPALRLDDGRILNEGASVLQYLADRRPEAGLAPAWGSDERYHLIDTLHYLGPRCTSGSSTTSSRVRCRPRRRRPRRPISSRRSPRSPGASATAKPWSATASPWPTPIS